MKSNYKMLGQFIRQVDIRNKDLKVSRLLGVSINKTFIESIANTVGTDFHNYKVVHKGQFAYGPVTSRNGDKVSIALLEEDECIISSSYSVFEVIDKHQLIPEYLMLWFSRPEFDRYARYKSHGSVREIFDWDEMCKVELPVPSYEEQLEIVNNYKTISERIELKNKINDNLVATVNAIYRKMFIGSGRTYQTIPLKQLCSKIGSGATPKGGKTSYQESGISLIRSTNVFDFTFSYDDLAHISDEQADQLSNVVVKENDVLFNITGVSVTRCCIVPADVLPARVNQHVMILRPNLAMPMSYYIMTTLCSAEIKAKLMGIAQSGSTREAINKQEVESFAIPVPSASEIQFFEVRARELYKSVTQSTEEIMRLNVMQKLLLSQLSGR